MSIDNRTYQKQILPAVSRTFALTIPQLPKPLDDLVTNAYLLCRIIDTIEDDPQISVEQKSYFHQQFVDVIASHASAEKFAHELTPLLSGQCLAKERELIENTARIIAVTHSFTAHQRLILQRCVVDMSRGMPLFEKQASLDGLATLSDLNRYCYFVAGVVGEMLTELFCDHVPQLKAKRDQMLMLAPSFGQGLQMTNILKDIWEDRKRGMCWLPQDVFNKYGFDLSTLKEQMHSNEFSQGLRQLVRFALGHLQNALEFTLLIPAQEKEIRRFCLWAIGLAVMTLRHIHFRPNFKSGKEVKVSRRMVKVIIFLANVSTRHDRLLRFWFRKAWYGLPKAIHSEISSILTLNNLSS